MSDQSNATLPRACSDILRTLRRTFANDDQDFADEVDREVLGRKYGTDSAVYRFLNDHPDGKAALAEMFQSFVAEGDTKGKSSKLNLAGVRTKGLLKVFLESGSTILYLAHFLAKDSAWHPDRSFASDGINVGDQSARLAALTNNNLAAQLLLQREDDRPALATYLLPGYLELKYEGLFTFFADGYENDRSLDQVKLGEERIGYAQTRAYLSGCDVLLLSASRLSLIFGPTVGSRQNAIFKNACYNACIPTLDAPALKEVNLFLTADKLIRHSSKSGANHGHSVDVELKNIHERKCFAVFDIEHKHARHSSPFSALSSELDQPLKDGTRAVRLGDGCFRVCHSWPDLFSKGGLRLRVFLAATDDQIPFIEEEVATATPELNSKGVEIQSNSTTCVSGNTRLVWLDIRPKGSPAEAVPWA